MASNSDVAALLSRLGGVYRDPSRISRDAISLIRSPVGSNLRPSISCLTQNDGTFSSAMVFQGTCPMTYRGRPYHIPVDIFLPPLYPVRPPVCYVRPVSNMVIKENHRHVGRDGTIYMQYLHNWNPNKSSLVEMTSSMSQLFGNEPPLFTKRTNKNPSPAPPPAPAPPKYHEIDYAKKTEANALNQRKQEEILRQQRLKEEQDCKRDEEIKMQSLKDEVTRKLKNNINIFFKDSRDWITTDLTDQNALSSAEKTITTQMDNLEALKIDLTERNSQIDEKLQLLKDTIQSKTMSQQPVISTDDLVTPVDINSEQMLKLASENAAITDCLYFLDKALVRGTISLDVHLKNVRRLAKRQFLVRAHCMKINVSKTGVEV